MSRAAGWICAALLGVACARKPPDATPEGAVRELLARMERVDGDAASARAAFELMGGTTRASLRERARRASAASGRPVEPWDMIAPSRFALRFHPQQMHARITGAQATVEVTGLEPSTEHASVACVLEGDAWRIEIALPPLPPVEKRPDGGT